MLLRIYRKRDNKQSFFPNPNNFGRDGHLVSGEAVGVTFAVDAFMVSAGIFYDFGQLFGERESFEHINGDNDMFVNFIPFFFINRSAADFKVIKFATVVGAEDLVFAVLRGGFSPRQGRSVCKNPSPPTSFPP